MAKQLSGAKISLNEKRQTFRAQIRKDTIKQLMQSRRRTLEQNSPDNLAVFTSEERDNIVQEAALQLTGQPSEEWLAQIDKLLICLSNFDGNFEFLLKTSILYNLSQLFTKKYDEIPWRHRAAILISNIVSKTKTPGLVSRLLTYNFLQQFFRIFSECQASITVEVCQDYIYLLGNIAGDNMAARNAVISAGAVSIVKKILDNISDYEMLELVLWLVSNLVKNDDEEEDQKLNYNLISPFLPSLDKYILLDHPKILKNILFSLFFLIDGKAYKMANVFHSPNIKNRLMELLVYENKDVRILSLKIVGCFCQSEVNKHFVTEFIRLGMFDQLDKSLRTYNYMKKEKKQFFIWIFNNVLKNSSQDLDYFIRHPIFTFAYEWLHKSQDQALRVEALTIFHSIFSFGTWIQFDYIFKSRPETLGMLVGCLQQSETAHAHLVLRALKCFLLLIPAYHEIYTPNENNKIAYILERQFNFENRFMELAYHKNDKISRNAIELFNIYGQTLSNMI